MKHSLPACLLAFIISGTALAADDNPCYIDMGKSLIIRPYLSMRQILLNFTYDKTGQDVSYTTNPGLVAGTSVAWGNLGLSAGYDIPFRDDDFKNDKKARGTLDLRLDFYGRALCFDFYYQHRKGFYLDEPEELGVSREADGSFPYYEDLKFSNISASLYYIFSHDKFSAKAAFDGSDIQKKSAGSFLLMSTAGMLSVKSGFPLIPESDEDDENGLNGLEGCDYSHFSVSPGYGHIFIFRSSYYLCGLAFLGAGLNYALYSTYDGTSRETNVFIKPNIRLASGYSGEKFFYGLSVISEMYIFPSRMEMTGSFLLFETRFFMGYRFL